MRGMGPAISVDSSHLWLVLLAPHLWRLGLPHGAPRYLRRLGDRLLRGRLATAALLLVREEEEASVHEHADADRQGHGNFELHDLVERLGHRHDVLHSGFSQTPCSLLSAAADVSCWGGTGGFARAA